MQQTDVKNLSQIAVVVERQRRELTLGKSYWVGLYSLLIFPVRSGLLPSSRLRVTLVYFDLRQIIPSDPQTLRPLRPLGAVACFLRVYFFSTPLCDLSRSCLFLDTLPCLPVFLEATYPLSAKPSCVFIASIHMQQYKWLRLLLSP